MNLRTLFYILIAAAMGITVMAVSGVQAGYQGDRDKFDARVIEVMEWIVEATDYDEVPSLPTIVFIPMERMNPTISTLTDTPLEMIGEVHAMYLPYYQLMILPSDPPDDLDAVLAHELLHHFQEVYTGSEGPMACRELAAHHLQIEFVEEFGIGYTSDPSVVIDYTLQCRSALMRGH